MKVSRAKALAFRRTHTESACTADCIGQLVRVMPASGGEHIDTPLCLVSGQGPVLCRIDKLLDAAHALPLSGGRA